MKIQECLKEFMSMNLVGPQKDLSTGTWNLPGIEAVFSFHLLSLLVCVHLLHTLLCLSANHAP